MKTMADVAEQAGAEGSGNDQTTRTPTTPAGQGRRRRSQPRSLFCALALALCVLGGLGGVAPLPADDCQATYDRAKKYAEEAAASSIRLLNKDLLDRRLGPGAYDKEMAVINKRKNEAFDDARREYNGCVAAAKARKLAPTNDLAILMRIADVQLSFPAILIALLIDGVARVALPDDRHGEIAIPVLILSIGISGWVQYARTVRGSTLVERNKEYVQAARVIGRHPLAIMIHHVLPNVTGPVLVIATIHIAPAILTEATLSFLGVGVPPTRPSLGTLIRVGNDFLFSGEWWITVFPGAALVMLVLSVNLLGDWLRDALNPKLR